MEFKPQRIIFHHSADGTKAYQFDKINAYHKTRGFPISTLGFYVGYHFLIEYDGSIRQARETSEIGAHDAGENYNSIGICLAGDFDIGFPNEAQIASIVKLVGELRSQFYIPVTHFEPHRWDDTTDCPGQNLPDNILVKWYLSRSDNPDFVTFFQIGEKYNLI